MSGRSINLPGKRSMAVLMKKCDPMLNRSCVGTGFPHPIASITIPGGENPPLLLHCRRGLLFLYFLRLLKTNFSEFAEGVAEGLFKIPLKTALVTSPDEFHDPADCQARVFG